MNNNSLPVFLCRGDGLGRDIDSVFVCIGSRIARKNRRLSGDDFSLYLRVYFVS